MLRCWVRNLALLTIGCFALLLVYALDQLVNIKRELSEDVGENMLWAVHQGLFETVRLQQAVALQQAGAGSEDAVQLRIDNLHARFAMLTDGPQRRYMQNRGVWPQLQEAAALVDGGPAGYPLLQRRLRDAGNQIMLGEREEAGRQRDSHERIMLQIILSVLGMLVAGAIVSWQLIYSLREANAATAEVIRQRDASEQMLLDLQEAQAGRRRYRDFVSLMSHQLLTPLAVIDSSAQRLLRQQTQEAASVHPRAVRIRGSVGRLTDLIGRVLGHLRLEELSAGSSRDATLQLCVWHEVLLEACARQAEVQPQRHVELFWQAPADPHLQLPCDRMWCEQILANLLSNAHKYSPVDRPVHLFTEVSEGQLRCTVRDFGAGMADEDLAQLFQRFHRGGHAQHLPGVGLGLSIARTLAEWQGGRLEARRADGGMAFTLSLPLAGVAQMPVADQVLTSA